MGQATAQMSGPHTHKQEMAIVESALADQLRTQPEKSYEFNRAALRDVIRLLADDSGISFISVPDSEVDENSMVTFTMKGSPFRVLEAITKASGVALFYDDGVWYLRPYDDQELIGRTYKLKYNTQETVENTGSSTTPTASAGAVGGTGVGGSSSTLPDASLSLQGSTTIFKVNPNPMIKDIRALLGLPTTGFSANIAPEATVDSTTPLGISPNEVKLRGPKNVASGPNGAQVIWNPDSNTLYVVATRQQHEWIEGYLASVDRPQNLIAIEVKFFESTKDPRKQLGLDWSGTLQEGYNVSLSNINATINGNSFINPVTGAPFVPGTAILSAQDVNVRLRAFMNDRDTSTVSYPRVLTVNNREVVIRSVVNQPVLASSSSVTPGVGGTTTSSVAYLPIGTIINVLPKVLSDNSIMLNVVITVSSIIGEEPIDGNAYPIATSRVYSAELHVDSGYTLAIGGLEEAVDLRDRNGIPYLKDIPLLGEAFKSYDHKRSRKNLMIFITPTMLDPLTTKGISETPQSVIPIKPNDPTPPVFTPEGVLVGGASSVDNAVRWVTMRRRFFEQTVKDHYTERKTIEEIKVLERICEMVLSQVGHLRTQRPREHPSYDSKIQELLNETQKIDAVKAKAKKDILKFSNS